MKVAFDWRPMTVEFRGETFSFQGRPLRNGSFLEALALAPEEPGDKPLRFLLLNQQALAAVMAESVRDFVGFETEAGDPVDSAEALRLLTEVAALAPLATEVLAEIVGISVLPKAAEGS